MFRSIIQAFVLPMLHPRQELALGCSIALQLIGDDHAWDVLESLEELAKKAFRRVCVPPALDEDIQHVAMLIHGPPERVRFPVDLQIHAHPGATCPHTEDVGDGVRSRMSDQTLNTTDVRFHTSQRSRAVRRPFFDIAKTEREAEIQPNCVADNFRWEAKAFVAWSSGVRFHEALLAHCSATFPS